MSFTKIFIHLVWSTKSRIPFISNEIRPVILEHIRQNAKLKNIFIEAINCQPDHLHCMISLGKSQCINEIVKLLKGESSRWINKETLINKRFAWQREYFAISVSEPHVEKVRQYIRNQDIHHQTKSYQQEHDAFMRLFNKQLG